MVTWNALKAWYDLVFNSQNGSLHYKSDIIGTVIVNQHDKKGVVLRRVTFQNVQITKLGGYSLDWSSNNIIENVPADFVYDYFIDEYILLPLFNEGVPDKLAGSRIIFYFILPFLIINLLALYFILKCIYRVIFKGKRTTTSQVRSPANHKPTSREKRDKVE